MPASDPFIARQHGGESGPENLAPACLNCNQHKGPNMAGRNPETGEVVELFHPGETAGAAIFEWNGADRIGKTTVGRATIRAVRIALRDEGGDTWD